jgi:hypothetical protein
MKKTLLVILISIAAVIVIGSGIILAYMAGYERGTSVPELSVLDNSKVIQSKNATAVGEISKIEGRTITLVSEGDVLDIPIKEEAEISTIIIETSEEETIPSISGITFEDLKVGDLVAVQLDLGPNDTFEGNSVIVNP